MLSKLILLNTLYIFGQKDLIYLLQKLTIC